MCWHNRWSRDERRRHVMRLYVWHVTKDVYVMRLHLANEPSQMHSVFIYYDIAIRWKMYYIARSQTNSSSSTRTMTWILYVCCTYVVSISKWLIRFISISSRCVGRTAVCNICTYMLLYCGQRLMTFQECVYQRVIGDGTNNHLSCLHMNPQSMCILGLRWV